MTTIYGLRESDWKELCTLLEPLRAAGATLYLFGSRARGTQTAFSDVDILISEGTSDVDAVISSVKESSEEGNFPLKIDLVRESRLAQSYASAVLRERIKLFGPDDSR